MAIGSIKRSKKKIVGALRRDINDPARARSRTVLIKAKIVRGHSLVSDWVGYRATVCPAGTSAKLDQFGKGPKRRRCGEGTGTTPTAALKKGVWDMLKKLK